MLGAVALLAGFGANGAAHAQTTDSGSTATYGSYRLDSAGEGLTITYNSPGLIPGTPSPLIAGSLPESMTNMDSGPSGYALASLVYPGPLIADLPTVLALGGVPNANQIPSYPVRSQAFYPAGPTAASQDVGSGRETTSADETTAHSEVVYGAAQAPPAITAGSVVSTSESVIEDAQVVTRTHVELTDVDIALGVIHIDSVVTDLVANSNGADAASDGTTTVNGVTVLGQPAVIDASGVHLTQPASSEPSSSSSASPLDPIGSAVQPALDPVDQLLVSTLGTADADVNQLLAQGGIEVRLIEPTEVKNGADVNRLASGVLITITYNGSTEPVLSNILNAIPVESLPNQGVGPVPFTSPQSLVLALKATHIETIGLAAGHVHASAAPPFSFPSVGSFSPIGTTGSSKGSTGFRTPTPSLGAGGSTPAGGGSSIGSASPIAFVGGEPLAAALVVFLLLLSGGVFWAGSSRLADNVLSQTSSSCPEGLDRGDTS